MKYPNGPPKQVLVSGSNAKGEHACTYLVASFPGCSQILSRSRDKIWEWPGKEVSTRKPDEYQRVDLAAVNIYEDISRYFT